MQEGRLIRERSNLRGILERDPGHCGLQTLRESGVQWGLRSDYGVNSFIINCFEYKLENANLAILWHYSMDYGKILLSGIE